MGIGEATARELVAHAAELAETAAREADHAALRRALVTLAIAGSAAPEFEATVAAVCAAARRLAIDPEPLFDAAAALVARDDPAAREALVLAPRRETQRPPGAGTLYGVLRPR